MLQTAPAALPPQIAERLGLSETGYYESFPEAQPQEKMWGWGRLPVRPSLTAVCGGKPQAKIESFKRVEMMWSKSTTALFGCGLGRAM